MALLHRFLVLVSLLSPMASAFFVTQSYTTPTGLAVTFPQSKTRLQQTMTTRSEWLLTNLLTSSVAIAVGFLPGPSVAAIERKSLEQCLYLILRVREATFQESRLINTGKFKDVQRANIKLAIKFILNNYRLSDTFIAASAYLDDNSRRVAAGEIGQNAVQDLQTILEYFDSSDVQNLKVGTNFDSGKERLVLQGLESARKNIDGFLEYFPSDTVELVRKQILEENALNVKEWDPTLGEIVNLPSAL